MDWSMILKMTVAMLLYVLITAWLCRLCRDKKPLGTGYRVLIGLVFGACSVASTHFGIPYQDTRFLNVQNMGPLAAGLFFSPLSGIIAGVIGGAERLLAGELWNVGRFTELACSLSTCLAGFVAAFLHRWVYKGERPPVSQAFFLGALTEVFHMYAILFTNRGSMTEAYSIVKIATVPMIAFTAVGMALCTIAVKKISGKSVKETLIKALHRQGESEKTRDFQHVKPKTLMLNRIKKRFLKPAIRFRSGRTPISMQVQRWLLVATIVMFLINFVGSYRFQTRIALETASVEVRYIGEKLKFRYETTHDIDEILSYIEKQDAMRDATLLVKLENGRYWTPEDIAEPEETLFLGQEDLQVVREHLDQPPFVISQGQEDEVLVQFLSFRNIFCASILRVW